jgi:hypothetical protein
MIREELRARGVEITVEHLRQVGNELRAGHGPGVLGERAVAKVASAGGNWAVTSIRHPREVEALRAAPDFTMVFVDAPRELRFERSLTRARPGDPLTLDEFRAAEEKQMNPEAGDPAAQALAATRELADRIIDNDGSIEAFEAKIEGLIAELSGG